MVLVVVVILLCCPVLGECLVTHHGDSMIVLNSKSTDVMIHDDDHSEGQRN